MLEEAGLGPLEAHLVAHPCATQWLTLQTFWSWPLVGNHRHGLGGGGHLFTSLSHPVGLLRLWEISTLPRATSGIGAAP